MSDKGVGGVSVYVGIVNHVSIMFLPAALHQLPQNSRLAAFSKLPAANHRWH